MIIKELTQVPFEEATKNKIDIFICSSGYEERSIYVSKELADIKIDQRLVLAFNDKKNELSRPKNDNYFQEENFEFLICDGDLEDNIYSKLEILVKAINKEKIIILVDYSCMTRIWYGAILKFFNFNSFTQSNIEILFAYSLAKYIKSSDKETYNIHIGPIRGFTSISVPQKPTALVIGLGYEKNRAIGLNEYFDGETFLFYSDSSKEFEYCNEVRTNNAEIISIIKKQNIYTYPMTDLSYTFSMLASLCLDIKRDYRVILAPCGPKPFTLISLILSLSLEDIDVWRISSGKEADSIDKKAEGEISVLKLQFVS